MTNECLENAPPTHQLVKPSQKWVRIKEITLHQRPVGDVFRGGVNERRGRVGKDSG